MALRDRPISSSRNILILSPYVTYIRTLKKFIVIIRFLECREFCNSLEAPKLVGLCTTEQRHVAAVDTAV